MSNHDDLTPAAKAVIVNIVGFCLLTGLLISYCWLPRDSLAFGPLNRIWRGMMAAISFGILEMDFILVIDWVTLGEWFDFTSDNAKAIILSSCIAGMVAVFIVG